jgi:hypothetical protein
MVGDVAYDDKNIPPVYSNPPIKVVYLGPIFNCNRPDSIVDKANDNKLIEYVVTTLALETPYASAIGSLNRLQAYSAPIATWTVNAAKVTTH